MRLDIAACPVVQSCAKLGYDQLGSLLDGGAKSGGGDIDSELKNFLGTSMRVELTVSRAALAFGAAYANEEERAKLQTRFDEIGKLTDPKEAGAKFQAVHESSDAAIKKLAASDDLDDRTSKLSNKKQRLLAKGAGNFMLRAMQAESLAPISGASGQTRRSVCATCCGDHSQPSRCVTSGHNRPEGSSLTIGCAARRLASAASCTCFDR